MTREAIKEMGEEIQAKATQILGYDDKIVNSIWIKEGFLNVTNGINQKC